MVLKKWARLQYFGVCVQYTTMSQNVVDDFDETPLEKEMPQAVDTTSETGQPESGDDEDDVAFVDEQVKRKKEKSNKRKRGRLGQPTLYGWVVRCSDRGGRRRARF